MQSEQGGRTVGSNFSEKWGWYPSIDTVANGLRITFEQATLLNIHRFLFDLEYRIDKANEEAKQFKKNE